MKIQCSGCDAAEAKVFCCADEAALCLACDEKIHSVNKLVSKHQRVSLSASSSSSWPKCDICQETYGNFICLEDRAVLCRICDVNIHTVNSHVRSHQRFLLAGVRVGLESAGLDKSYSKQKMHASEKVVAHAGSTFGTEADSSTLPTNVSTLPVRDADAVKDHERLETPLDSRTATKEIADRRFKDILELIDSSSNNPSTQQGLSKETKATDLGNSEWWKILRKTEEELLNDNFQSKDDISWTVPQLLPGQYSISGSNSSTGVLNTKDTGNVITAVDDFQFCQSPINAKCSGRPKTQGLKGLMRKKHLHG